MGCAVSSKQTKQQSTSPHNINNKDFIHSNSINRAAHRNSISIHKQHSIKATTENQLDKQNNVPNENPEGKNEADNLNLVQQQNIVRTPLKKITEKPFVEEVDVNSPQLGHTLENKNNQEPQQSNQIEQQ